MSRILKVLTVGGHYPNAMNLYTALLVTGPAEHDYHISIREAREAMERREFDVIFAWHKLRTESLLSDLRQPAGGVKAAVATPFFYVVHEPLPGEFFGAHTNAAHLVEPLYAPWDPRALRAAIAIWVPDWARHDGAPNH